MAELSDIEAAQSVKIIGATATGVETNPVAVNSAGSLQVAGEGVVGTPAGGVATVQGGSTSTPSLSAPGVITRVLPYEPETFSAAASAFIPPAAATDVFTIRGSATKTVRIHSIRITGSTTSGTPIRVTLQLIKRSAANTGGVSLTQTMVPHDSLNAASGSEVRSYTMNALTLGAAVGILRSSHVTVANTGISGGHVLWDLERIGQPVTLRGVNDFLCVNFNAATITGPIFGISVEWSEV